MEEIIVTITERLKELAQVVPNLITALLVILVGYILARVLRRAIGKLLAKIGIDKLAERVNEVDVFAANNIKIVPSSILSSIVYYLVLFVFMMVGVDALKMEAISDLMTNIINYLPKALAALVIFMIGVVFCDLIKNMVRTACESLGIGSARFLANVVFYFLFLNVILVTMKQAELQTAFMENNISIVLGGVIFAFSIGYGLASRNLMANMLAAFNHKDRLQVGDEVSVGDFRGKVIALDSTSLTLRGETEEEIIIPLSKLTADTYIVHERASYVALEDPDNE
ncbi:MAG: mechanosensitive ion channel domain-containing protein [Bacteroidota bacterium]